MGQHHAAVVEGSRGQHALAKLVRDLVDAIVGFVALAQEYRVAHAIGRGERMMLVVDQQQLFASLGVREADATGRRMVGDGPDAADRGEFGVVEFEQRSKRLGGKAKNTKDHSEGSKLVGSLL